MSNGLTVLPGVPSALVPGVAEALAELGEVFLLFDGEPAAGATGQPPDPTRG